MHRQPEICFHHEWSGIPAVIEVMLLQMPVLFGIDLHQPVKIGAGRTVYTVHLTYRPGYGSVQIAGTT